MKNFLLRGIHLLSTWRTLHTSRFKMAMSKFEYVKSFETTGVLDPAHWIVITLRCQNLDTISQVHKFQRPNDIRFHQVMEASAVSVMEEFKELVLGYGFSGEFNFVFAKNTTLYKRRGPKLLTNICSLMATTFVHTWSSYFESVTLNCLPVFKGIIHLFPDDQILRDYLTKEQLVCHQKNLYNTAMWSLVSTEGLMPQDAASALKGTSEGEQNEILFSKCNINYNNENPVFKKGTIAVRCKKQVPVTTPDGSVTQRNQSTIVTMQSDFNKDKFWTETFALQQPTKHNSKTSYVKAFEKNMELLPQTWLVVRIDGKGFHRFSEKHNFEKPNDIRSIELMNRAAYQVMNTYPDIVLSYGDSDEYSFIIHKDSKMMKRKENTIISSIVSLFAAKYVYDWQDVFVGVPLQYCPAFDARVVLYPNIKCLHDYLSWRQADCHINNMYNTCFWMLVQRGSYSRRRAEEKLCGTFSDDKRAILLTEFNLDYDQEEAIYRKGTIMIRRNPSEKESDQPYHKENENGPVNKPHDICSSGKEGKHKGESGPISISHYSCVHGEENSGVSYLDDFVIEHTDLINDTFWEERHWLLSDKSRG